MITLKKILVPTDFSKHSIKAVQYAAELANKFEAEVHLLHVVDAIPMTDGLYIPPVAKSEIDANVTRELEGVSVKPLNESKVTRSHVDGRPFVEVIRYASNNEIDLIVLGTHGRGAVAHMLLGNVAEKVVRKASCPVLVVRDEQHDFVMP